MLKYLIDYLFRTFPIKTLNDITVYYNGVMLVDGMAINPRTGKPFQNDEITRITITSKINNVAEIDFNYSKLIISDDLSGFQNPQTFKASYKIQMEPNKFYILII